MVIEAARNLAGLDGASSAEFDPDSPHPVIAWVDHQNLTYFRKPQHLSQQQARLLMFISRFELQITHLAGKGPQMLVPDILS